MAKYSAFEIAKDIANNKLSDFGAAYQQVREQRRNEDQDASESQYANGSRQERNK